MEMLSKTVDLPIFAMCLCALIQAWLYNFRCLFASNFIMYLIDMKHIDNPKREKMLYKKTSNFSNLCFIIFTTICMTYLIAGNINSNNNDILIILMFFMTLSHIMCNIVIKNIIKIEISFIDIILLLCVITLPIITMIILLITYIE